MSSRDDNQAPHDWTPPPRDEVEPDAATLPAAPAPTAPSTLGQQVARARAEMATWPTEQRASVRLQGGDAAAPTRATAEQEAEIDAAVKAGRVTFEPGWDGPRPAEAPTEQPEHETIVREGNMLTCTACGTSKKMADPCAAPTEQAGELPPLPNPDGDWAGDDWFTTATLQDYTRAALAARQAPTEAPKEHPVGYISASELRDLENGTVAFVVPAQDRKAYILLFRQSPDSRDAADAERYRRLFTIDDFCRDPLWPVVEWMRGGEQTKEDIDAALDTVTAQEKAQ